MIVLPSLREFTKLRPYKSSFEKEHLVPDYETYSDFWKTVHNFLYSLSLGFPLNDENFEKYINPEHGYFGERKHPIKKDDKYFHIGIQLDLKPKTEIKPLLSGILEYSGYEAVNGYYVLLSHPNIKTEDGYVLHTMYCHLKKPLVKFSSYQKMLREISLGSYPLIPISSTEILGYAGNSGVTDFEKPRLYIQCDFRKPDHDPIVVDPMNFFTQKDFKNKRI